MKETVKQKLSKILVAHGMSDNQAEAVMIIAIPLLQQSAKEIGHSITLDAPAEDYPEIMYHLWFKQIKPVALQWIEENKPHAWFKPMFEDQNPNKPLVADVDTLSTYFNK